MPGGRNFVPLNERVVWKLLCQSQYSRMSLPDGHAKSARVEDLHAVDTVLAAFWKGRDDYKATSGP